MKPLLLFASIGLFALLMVVGLSESQQFFTKANQPSPTPLVVSSSKLWNLVEKYRTDNNLTPLIQDDKLCELANIRVTEIKTDWSHNGFESKYSQYSFKHIGENLVEGYNENDALNAWIHSASHEANLRYPYQYSCIVCSNSYCAQEFGAK